MDTMRHGRLITIVVLITLFSSNMCCRMEAAANNSNDTINLKELSVEAKSLSITNGKITITPTPTAKKLAKDIKSLVELSHAGLFTIIDGQVTVNGQPVTIFINGEITDNIDQQTFWAKNVLRLEYFEDSDDLTFLGKNRVLNIVMKDYSAGGLTRLNANQEIPNNGDYDISTKLVLKPITINAFSGYSYEYNQNKGYDMTEDYRDVWFNEQLFNKILQHEFMSTYGRKGTYSCGINLRQKSKKFYSVHSASFFTSRNRTNECGETSFEPEICLSDYQQNYNNQKNTGFIVNGNYQYMLNDKFTFSAEWNVSKNFNYDNRLYELIDFSNIQTNVNERAFGAFFKFNLGYQIRRNMFFIIKLSEKYSKFKASYSGSTQSEQLQEHKITDFDIPLNWKPLSNLHLRIQPSVSIQKKNINSVYCTTNVLPAASFGASYTINDMSTFFAGIYYNLTNPTANSLNILVLQQDALKWLKGNPSLKPSQYYSFDAVYYCAPANWLNLNLSAGTSITTNQSVISYNQVDKEYNGIIGEYVNGLTIEHYFTQLTTSISLRDRRLDIMPIMMVSYDRVRKINSTFFFRPQLYTSLLIKDVRIKAMCAAPEKVLLEAGNEKLNTYWQYCLGIDFAIGNIIFSAELNNIFNKHNVSTRYYRSSHYNFDKRISERGRYAAISLTYTFDYGKKVERNIEIDHYTNQTTSILSK